MAARRRRTDEKGVHYAESLPKVRDRKQKGSRVHAFRVYSCFAESYTSTEEVGTHEVAMHYKEREHGKREFQNFLSFAYR